MKKAIAPFVRSPYNYDTEHASDESGLQCQDKSRAQQHMVDDTDINKLVERYLVTGEMPQLKAPPLQGDFSQVMTYQESLNLMIEAQRSFDALPAKIRNRFENDPGQFVDFCSNEANRDEVRQMGLYSPEAIRAYQDKAEAAKAAQDALNRDGEAFRALQKTPPEKGAA
ncbi:MAG: internal scaffolding protein [Microvirus sp.]|nr:MAG: internal scaffolding protein [Microvirus sp.]